MNSAKGRDLHTQVEHSREREQDFLKSLKLAEEAIIAYQEDKDYRGVSEVLQSRSSTYKHLYQKTKDEVYLTLAKHDALSGIEIAESLDDKSGLAMVYRGMGKILEQMKDWSEMKKYFEKAIEAFKTNPPKENNRPAVLSDMKAHLAFGMYMSGNKSGLDLMKEAIAELTDSDEWKYNRDVWLSGAHMRAAEMLREDNLDLAKEHLQKAKEIIDGNPELVLRKEQWEELNKTFTE